MATHYYQIITQEPGEKTKMAASMLLGGMQENSLVFHEKCRFNSAGRQTCGVQGETGNRWRQGKTEVREDGGGQEQFEPRDSEENMLAVTGSCEYHPASSQQEPSRSEPDFPWSEIKTIEGQTGHHTSPGRQKSPKEPTATTRDEGRGHRQAPFFAIKALVVVGINTIWETERGKSALKRVKRARNCHSKVVESTNN